MQRVPEPRDDEAAGGGGGVFLSSTGNTAPRSGSVRAIDGSAITWTTAANGTINAVGTVGQQMVISPIQESAGESAVRVTFAVARQGTYLTLDRSINENNRVASVGISGGRSQATLDITVSGPTTGTGTASGSFAAIRFRWSGPVNLSANPFSALRRAEGFDSNAFTSQLNEASYFAPACRVLAGIPSDRTPVTGPPVLRAPSEPVIRERSESWGQFLGHAATWGLAALGAAALTAGTGGLDLVVGAAVFMTAADASMINDDIDLASSQSGDTSQSPDTGDGDAGSDGGDGEDSGGGDGGGGEGIDDTPPREPE
jgi:hypothetical protein